MINLKVNMSMKKMLCLWGSLVLASMQPVSAKVPHQHYTAWHSMMLGPGDGAPANPPMSRFSRYAQALFHKAGLDAAGLKESVFSKALIGYFNLCKQDKLSMDHAVLTIIDFHVPSVEKRLWVIDLTAGRLLLHTWVAHGQGSGKEDARRFSNHMGSHESSLGFYLTGDVYQGEHGTSLKLIGLDPGFNSEAAARHIVIHPADYVTPSFIAQNGYLGRSFGCPAVPPSVSDSLIQTIQGKTLLFIDGPDPRYHSRYLNPHTAALAAERLLNTSADTLSGED